MVYRVENLMDSFRHVPHATSIKCVRLTKMICRSSLPIIYIIPAKLQLVYYFRVRVMMFNVTFNTISIISWRTVLFMEETEVPVVHLA